MAGDTAADRQALVEVINLGLVWHCLCAITRLEVPERLAAGPLPISQLAAAVGADPDALAHLRARVLAPLAELSEPSRERLAETLRCWLLHQGRRDEVAAQGVALVGAVDGEECRRAAAFVSDEIAHGRPRPGPSDGVPGQDTAAAAARPVDFPAARAGGRAVRFSRC